MLPKEPHFVSIHAVNLLDDPSPYLRLSDSLFLPDATQTCTIIAAAGKPADFRVGYDPKFLGLLLILIYGCDILHIPFFLLEIDMHRLSKLLNIIGKRAG